MWFMSKSRVNWKWSLVWKRKLNYPDCVGPDVMMMVFIQIDVRDNYQLLALILRPVLCFISSWLSSLQFLVYLSEVRERDSNIDKTVCCWQIVWTVTHFLMANIVKQTKDKLSDWSPPIIFISQDWEEQREVVCHWLCPECLIVVAGPGQWLIYILFPASRSSWKHHH